MTEQMKHEMFAQNLKNMGIAKRDMTATKKVMKQLNDHFCPKFCSDGQYCPLSGYPSLVTCSNDDECTYCMIGIFERLIEHLEAHLEGHDTNGNT